MRRQPRQRLYFPGVGFQGVKILHFPLRFCACLAEWERQKETVWGKEET